MAEMEGFEPPHALRRLADFESENPIGLSLPYFPVNGQLYPTVSPHFTHYNTVNQYISREFESLSGTQKNLDFGENQERTERT